ncbi:MAG TPA: Ppx/GppA phosphatase family protein, partial [Telluria sp.]|nr:Ppx/GppA phosphatase family protein [Telluria sp.]
AAFLARAEETLGHPVDVISGEEEGRLVYLGVANTLGGAHERRLVADIGGAATGLVLGRGQEVERVESLPIGTVRQNLSFFVGGRIEPRSFDAAVLSARSYFEDAAPPYHPQHWKEAYGTSGTIRTLADIAARNDLGDGVLTLDTLHALKRRLLDFGHTTRAAMPGLRPDRAGSVAGGLAILIALMMELGIERLTPVQAGLRVGVLWDLFHRAQRRDRREDAVVALAARMHGDPQRGVRAAANAATLFAQLQPEPCEAGQLLRWAALLHEIGMAVSQSGYHKHAAYLAEHADLPGFTAREQRFMGRLLLAQKGSLRKVPELLDEPDMIRAVLALRLAIVLMHCRLDADPASLRLRMGGRIDLEIRRDLLAAHPTLAWWLEKEQECWDEIGIDLGIRRQAPP